MSKPILLLIPLAIFAVRCSPVDQNIPEPNYNPHVLKPGKYVPATGMIINMDSVAPPTYVPANGRYMKAGPPKYVPLKSNYHLAGAPKYVRAISKD